MTDGDGAEKYLDVINELLLEDEMHRFRRTGRRIRVADIPSNEIAIQAISDFFEPWNAEFRRDPLSELNEYADTLKAELVAEGWPSWTARVEHLEGDDWREVTQAEMRSVHSPRASFSTGESFILSRVKPPSDDYFRAKICYKIWKLCNIENENRKILMALDLGEFISIWEHRRAFKRLVKARRDQLRGQAESREVRNAKAAATARAWEAEARAIAAEIWARNPTPSASALAPKVREELARRGVVNAEGEAPSESRIRKSIAPEKPRRAAKSGRAV